MTCEEKDNLFEAFSRFWEAADNVRNEIREHHDAECVYSAAYDLAHEMDLYEEALEQHDPEEK